MLEKLAWYILARQEKIHRSKGNIHEAEHINACMSVRMQKGCQMCCVLENTDWYAWAARFDPATAEKARNSPCLHQKDENIAEIYIAQ
jgi:hypothetical protein